MKMKRGWTYTVATSMPSFAVLWSLHHPKIIAPMNDPTLYLRLSRVYNLIGCDKVKDTLQQSSQRNLYLRQAEWVLEGDKEVKRKRGKRGKRNV